MAVELCQGTEMTKLHVGGTWTNSYCVEHFDTYGMKPVASQNR